MGLSNYLPSSRISQSGVCTSTTRPASPYEGQVIYETDTNRVLVYDNAAWVMVLDTDQPPGLQLIKTQTIGSAVSSVTVTDAFSADFENYKIVVTGGSATANTTFSLQLGATTTGYYTFAISGSFTSTTITGANIANGSSFNAAGRCAPNGIFTVVELFLPYETQRTMYTSTNTRPETAGFAGWQTGYLNDATSYTEFTLIPSSATFTGGTIRVYGYRN